MNAHTARRFGILAALPLLAGSVASAQFVEDADQPEVVPSYVNSNEAADMVFESMDHDFGLISDSEQVEYVFKFTNEGKGPLQIASTKGSCSCTIPALSKKTFAPGESGEIRVIFDPNKKSGRQSQNVTINTNDADTPVLLLRVMANIMPQVMVTPRVGHFGEVAKDTSAEIELKVLGRNEDFQLTGFELSDPDLFSVTLGDTIESEFDVNADTGRADQPSEPRLIPVRESKVKIKFLPGQDIGLIRNKVLTLTTNDPKHPTVQVELMAQHKGDIDMVPRRISLGSLEAGTEFAKEVTISSLSGTPFKVLGVEHTSVVEDAVKYTFEPVDPDNPTSYRISINGAMPESARVLRGRLVIKTDMDRENELFLHYYGQQRVTTTTRR